MGEEGVKKGGMAIHGNEYHDPDFEVEGVAAGLVNTHEVKTTGVHGVGAGTVAKVGDVAVDANLSAAAQDAISKKHTQNTDTHLGTIDQDISLSTHKLTTLSVPVNAGDSIRATAKITEANLESAVDLKHDQLHHATHEPGGNDAMAVDAAAAIGSLRTLGAGALQAAAGNHTHTLISGGSGSGNAGTTASLSSTYRRASIIIAPLSRYEMTININCNGGRVFGVACCWGHTSIANSVLIGLYIDDVSLGESGFLSSTGNGLPVFLLGFLTVGTGVKPVRAALKNTSASAVTVYFYGATTPLYQPLILAAGEVKI